MLCRHEGHGVPQHLPGRRAAQSTDAHEARRQVGVPTQEDRLGRQIRRLRHEQGLTLVALAALTDLSHPFLSQLERGLARPSMTSLGRIAKALRSSQSELMARTAQSAQSQQRSPFTVVRADEGTELPSPGGSARLLVQGTAGFHPMLYVGDNSEFQEYYQHPEDEFVHVVQGAIEVDLGDCGCAQLAVGDSLYYCGGTVHRWRTLQTGGYRLLAVKEVTAR
jgi:transcriptional regulator with XRE-family HTH domain